jgi:hypothetical protein
VAVLLRLPRNGSSLALGWIVTGAARGINFPRVRRFDFMVVGVRDLHVHGGVIGEHQTSAAEQWPGRSAPKRENWANCASVFAHRSIGKQQWSWPARKERFEQMKRSNIGVIALLVALGAILMGVGYFAYEGLTVGEGSLPADFYIAMTLGIVFSLVVGVGLMALVFYSARHGYDEPPSLRE